MKKAIAEVMVIANTVPSYTDVPGISDFCIWQETLSDYNFWSTIYDAPDKTVNIRKEKKMAKKKESKQMKKKKAKKKPRTRYPSG